MLSEEKIQVRDTMAHFVNNFLTGEMPLEEIVSSLVLMGIAEPHKVAVQLLKFKSASDRAITLENASDPNNSSDSSSIISRVVQFSSSVVNHLLTRSLEQMHLSADGGTIIPERTGASNSTSLTDIVKNWEAMEESLKILEVIPLEISKALVNHPHVYRSSLPDILKNAHAQHNPQDHRNPSAIVYSCLCYTFITFGYKMISSSIPYLDVAYMLCELNKLNFRVDFKPQAMANICLQVWGDEPDGFWATLLTALWQKNSELYPYFLVNDKAQYKQQTFGHVEEHLTSPLALLVLGYIGVDSIPSFKDTTMLKIHQLYWFYYDQANSLSTAPNPVQLSRAIATLAHEQTGKGQSWLTRPDANAQKWQHFQVNALTLFAQKPSGTTSAPLKNFFDHAAMEAELTAWKKAVLTLLNKRIGVYSEEKHDDEQADRIKDALLSLRTLFTQLPTAPESNFELMPHMKKIQTSLDACVALVKETEFRDSNEKKGFLKELKRRQTRCSQLLERLEGEQQLTARSDSNQRPMLARRK